jgi:hypothetical protein
MTFAEKQAEIEESHGKAMAAARAEEDARIDREKREAAAVTYFGANYVRPDWNTLGAAVLKPIGELVRSERPASALLSEFSAALKAAKEAVEPMEKFFHKAFVEEWHMWLRTCDHVFGRAAGKRTASDRESFSSDLGGLQSGPGRFFTLSTPGVDGNRLNDNIALAQTIPAEELAPYMAEAV